MLVEPGDAVMHARCSCIKLGGTQYTANMFGPVQGSYISNNP